MNATHVPSFLDNFLTSQHPRLTDAEVEIICHISGHIVLNDRLTQGGDMIKRILAENAALSEPRHGILIGEAGCGKTTLMDLVKVELPTRDETFRLGIRSSIPALFISLPSTITPRSMACQMLRAIGDQSGLHGTCFALTERLCRYIKDCQVKLILLDEFQHLLALGRGNKRGANRRLLEARNWIKSVINSTHVSFVVMGMPETVALIEDEDQLERRFTHLLTMDPFDVPTSGNTEMVDFVDDLLLDACHNLPHFSNAEFLKDCTADASRLFAATAGVPSRLKDLVIRAALAAHRRGSSEIAMIDFTSGFEQRHRARLVFEAAKQRREHRRSLLEALDGRVINPFAASNDEIDQLIMKMAA